MGFLCCTDPDDVVEESTKVESASDEGVSKIKCEPKEEEPEARLVALEVIGHHKVDDHNWWVVYDTGGSVQIRAVTEPNDNTAWDKIQWDMGNLQAMGEQIRQQVPNTLGTFTVTASITGGDQQQVTIEVVPELESVTVTENAEDKGPHWKAYKGGEKIVVRVKTKPDTAEAWDAVHWNEGTPSVNNRETKINMDTTRDAQVKATIKTQEQSVNLHICQLPELEIDEITFSNNHPVKEDTVTDFHAPEWKKGRAAIRQVPAEIRPVCYTRDNKIELSAKFKVKTKPTDDEEVFLRGTTTIGGTTLKWEKDKFQVKKADAEVTLAATESDNKIPNQVACYENVEITWEVNPDAAYKSSAEKSKHLIYVTLDDPQVAAKVYWTLLDISCRAASTKTDEAGVVSKIQEKFHSLNLKRKWDDKPLKYWGKDDPAQHSTRDFLQEGDGCGSCKAWSSILVDMLGVHDIDSTMVEIEVNKPNAHRWGFMVKNWTFHGPAVSDGGSLTHDVHTINRNVVEADCCHPAVGVGGQNNAAPPPVFENHFIVKLDSTNKYYDPSYGAGPIDDQATWESSSIDGLLDVTVWRAGYDKSKRGGLANLLTFT